MTENFPKLMSATKSQIQEVQKTSVSINVMKPAARHVVFKLQKIKLNENILKLLSKIRTSSKRSKIKNGLQLQFRNHATNTRVE